MSAAGGVTYAYDDNGNNTSSSDGRVITYNTFDKYTLSDHLGSVDVITSDSGAITQQLSFDTWGLRRNAVNWQELPASSITNFNTDLTRRGFTGHEHMDEVGIIHMNGRIYDPRLGRFLQADSFVPDPGNVASHNRYSYVYNNPLNATDPSGHFVFTLAAAILVAAVKVTTLQVLVAFAVAGIADALVQGASFGEALKAGIISGVTAVALAGVSGAFTNAGWASGSFVGKLSAAGFEARVAVHGLLGGISSVLSGGKFGHGFASAGFTAAATMFSYWKFPKALSKAGPRVVVNATIRGTASKLSGRKFANGGVTAAFAYTLSALANSNSLNRHVGGRGIPKEGFVLDENGNIVFSDEVQGAFVESEKAVVTDSFAEKRFTKDGVSYFHAGKDIVPLNMDGTVSTDSYAISGTEGKILAIRSASGFGDSTLIVGTPGGNHVIYGHMESVAPNLFEGQPVSIGTRLGIIGNEGLSTSAHATKGLHLHVEIRQGHTPFLGKRYGIK